MQPPAGANQNIFAMTEAQREEAHIDTLPGDLITANKYFVEDSLICNLFGEHVVNSIDSMAKIEWDAFRTTVHQWEIDQYLTRY